MKTLIFSGVFCQREDNRDLVKLWGRMATHLNPNVDIVVFDSCSPFNPDYFLPDSIHVHHFTENPGHLSQGGGDGAGRTFCAGIEYAAERGYDFAVHLESDMLLSKPVGELIQRMAQADVKAAACYLPQYQFPEFGICAMDVEHMMQTDFVGRYDWQNSPKWPIPERRIAELFGDDLWLLPWYGTRNDHNQLNQHTMHLSFPYENPTWLTHINLDVAHKFLELHGIELPE